MKKITAVIPIRKGSQRVINKNLRPFAGSDLLTIKINNLKKVKGIDDIVVNTDSEDAIEIAINLGVNFHRREDYYASSECTGSDFFEHLGNVTETEIFAYCPVTSPFVKIETMEEAIKDFYNDVNHDCLSTVSVVKEFLWLDGKAVNYDPENAPNSQNLPNIEALNFGFTLVRREDLIKNRNIIGKKPKFTKTTDIESIDIDTPLDFFVAEQIYIKTVLETKGLLD
ncbi:acylneuraminate cytidylyltransferase family protein [Flavobacterium sp. ARAG 55.4]|uniref:acylneuraminate cytidylyltransferase family protein n=1 Tax=Flavobacterium sp. ARAG 55.4 TaxID=3451357 RepID=UPI003F44CEA2